MITQSQYKAMNLGRKFRSLELDKKKIHKHLFYIQNIDSARGNKDVDMALDLMIAKASKIQTLIIKLKKSL